MTYITVTEVRNNSGVPTSLLSDSVLEGFIDYVEEEMETWVNTVFTPTEKIEVLDGSGSDRVILKKNPVLSLRYLKNYDSEMSVSAVEVYEQGGMLVLSGNAESSVFVKKDKSVISKYVYGLVDESKTIKTTSTSATIAGTSIVISVVSVSSFAADDWVKIYGIDGKTEAAKITSVSSGDLTITVDQLVHTHVSGSEIVQLNIPKKIKRYMIIEASIASALAAIGKTYTFNAGYSIGDFSVTKGVPYTHFQSQVDRLMKERNLRSIKIRPRPYITS